MKKRNMPDMAPPRFRGGEDNSEELKTVPEAASYLRVSKSYLDKLRVYGGGPPFLRLGVKKIAYRRSDLDAWLARRRFNSTSEYGAASEADHKRGLPE